MNLVPREEFDIQQAVLERTREKLEQLEQRGREHHLLEAEVGAEARQRVQNSGGIADQQHSALGIEVPDHMLGQGEDEAPVNVQYRPEASLDGRLDLGALGLLVDFPAGVLSIHGLDVVSAQAGWGTFKACGMALPEATLEAIRTYRVAIKGPLTTPVGGGIRSVNVQLRQVLDLYACVRPVRYIAGIPSPMKAPENVDMVVFRENTEDVYIGYEWEADSPMAKKLIENHSA